MSRGGSILASGEDLAQYAHLDANRSAVWMGGPSADPLAEALARSAARDVAATRVYCRVGVGPIAWKTPDTLAVLSRAIAPILPALRLERIACPRGGMPVACYRGEQRVGLDELADVERDALHVVAALHAANVRGGVVLIDSPDLHVTREEHARWRDWLAGVAAPNQLFVASVSAEIHGRHDTSAAFTVDQGTDGEASQVASVDDERGQVRLLSARGGGSMPTMRSAPTPERTGSASWASSVPVRSDQWSVEQGVVDDSSKLRPAATS